MMKFVPLQTPANTIRGTDSRARRRHPTVSGPATHLDSGRHQTPGQARPGRKTSGECRALSGLGQRKKTAPRAALPRSVVTWLLAREIQESGHWDAGKTVGDGCGARIHGRLRRTADRRVDETSH